MQRFFDEARCLPKENIRWLRGTIDGGSTIHSGNLVHQPPIQILLEESPFGGIGVTNKPKAFDHEVGKIFKCADDSQVYNTHWYLEALLLARATRSRQRWEILSPCLHML